MGKERLAREWLTSVLLLRLKRILMMMMMRLLKRMPLLLLR